MFLFAKEHRHGILLDHPLNDPGCCRQCDGDCCRAFVSIALSWEEYRRLEALEAKRLHLPLFGPPLLIIDNGCEFLLHGQCSIYHDRPEICRLFICEHRPPAERFRPKIEPAPEHFFPGI